MNQFKKNLCLVIYRVINLIIGIKFMNDNNNK